MKPRITELEAERMTQREVQAILRCGKRYRNPEDAEQQALREQLTTEVVRRDLGRKYRIVQSR